MQPQPSIVIVGGSLVGPATELFLRNEGFTNVTTYEAMKTPHSQSGGVMGVRFGNLDLLAGVGINRRDVVALKDPDVHAFDVGPNGTYTTRGSSTFPGLVSSWDALHYELRTRVAVQYGHTIRGITDDGGLQYLVCSCGSTHTAHIVIWADGRKSTGRTLLDPDQPLEYNGYVVWRGLVDPPTPNPHGFHRYYDIPGGRLFSMTEPIMQSGKSYWEFSHNLDADTWTSLAHGRPEKHAFMLPHQVTPAVHDVIRHHAAGMPHQFVDMVESSDISGIPVNDVPMPASAINKRGNGYSIRLGDALVPVRLQVGAGLNHGLQQAADLAAALNNPDQAVALDCWDQATRSNLARVVEQGRARAHRINLGWYLPVRPGRTTAPGADQWDTPQWVTA